MPCPPRASSFLFVLVSSLAVAGCVDEDEPPPEVRHQTPHALVWNGRVGLEPGALPAEPRILVFDAPVRCFELLAPQSPGQRALPNVKLALIARPETWTTGATMKFENLQLFDGNGRELIDDGRNLRPSLSKLDLALRSAPTKNGSRALLRLELQVLFAREAQTCDPDDEHVLDLSGELEAEICGDIQ